MTTIFRNLKGSNLTPDEVDGNFRSISNNLSDIGVNVVSSMSSISSVSNSLSSVSSILTDNINIVNEVSNTLSSNLVQVSGITVGLSSVSSSLSNLNSFTLSNISDISSTLSQTNNNLAVNISSTNSLISVLSSSIVTSGGNVTGVSNNLSNVSSNLFSISGSLSNVSSSLLNKYGDTALGRFVFDSTSDTTPYPIKFTHSNVFTNSPTPYGSGSVLFQTTGQNNNQAIVIMEKTSDSSSFGNGANLILKNYGGSTATGDSTFAVDLEFVCNNPYTTESRPEGGKYEIGTLSNTNSAGKTGGGLFYIASRRGVQHPSGRNTGFERFVNFYPLTKGGEIESYGNGLSITPLYDFGTTTFLTLSSAFAGSRLELTSTATDPTNSTCYINLNSNSTGSDTTGGKWQMQASGTNGRFVIKNLSHGSTAIEILDSVSEGLTAFYNSNDITAGGIRLGNSTYSQLIKASNREFDFRTNGSTYLKTNGSNYVTVNSTNSVALTDGGVITVVPDSSHMIYYINTSSVVPSATYTLPDLPVDGQMVTFITRAGSVTTLTVNSAGSATIFENPVRHGSGTQISFIYYASGNSWYNLTPNKRLDTISSSLSSLSSNLSNVSSSLTAVGASLINVSLIDGQTVTATATSQVMNYIINTASTVATATYTLPANPQNAQEFVFTTRQGSVTSLTVNSANSAVIYNLPTTHPANSQISFVYYASGNVWYSKSMVNRINSVSSTVSIVSSNLSLVSSTISLLSSTISLVSSGLSTSNSTISVLSSNISGVSSSLSNVSSTLNILTGLVTSVALADGGTITATATKLAMNYIINTASALSTATYTLPDLPVDGQVINFYTRQGSVATLIINSAGSATIYSKPTSHAPNTHISFIYYASGNVWYAKENALKIDLISSNLSLVSSRLSLVSSTLSSVSSSLSGVSSSLILTSSNLSLVSSTLSTISSGLIDGSGINKAKFIDEFLNLVSWTTTTAGLGGAGATVNTTIVPHSNRFGIVELYTGTSMNNAVSIEKTGQYLTLTSSPVTIDIIFGFATVDANQRVLIGYFNSVGTSTTSINSGFGIEYNQANATTIQGITSTGVANTFQRASLGITPTTTTPIGIRIIATTSSVDYYQINSVGSYTLITSMTLLLNGSNIIPTIKHIKTGGTSNQSIWCDTIYTERVLNKLNA